MASTGRDFLQTLLRDAVERQQRRYDTLILVVSLLVTVSVGFLAAAIADSSDSFGWRIAASAATGVALLGAVALLFGENVRAPSTREIFLRWTSQNESLDALADDYVRSLFDAFVVNGGRINRSTAIGMVAVLCAMASTGMSISLLLNTA